MAQSYRIPSIFKSAEVKAAEAKLWRSKNEAGDDPVPVSLRDVGAFRIVRIGATKIADQWVSTSMVDTRAIFEGTWRFISISVRNADSHVAEPTEIYMYDGSDGGNGAISLNSGYTNEYQKLHAKQLPFLGRGHWIPRARIYCSTENTDDLFYIDIVAEKIDEGV